MVSHWQEVQWLIVLRSQNVPHANTNTVLSSALRIETEIGKNSVQTITLYQPQPRNCSLKTYSIEAPHTFLWAYGRQGAFMTDICVIAWLKHPLIHVWRSVCRDERLRAWLIVTVSSSGAWDAAAIPDAAGWECWGWKGNVRAYWTLYMITSLCMALDV